MRITFYTFNMGDVYDVDVYANQMIDQWQNTKQGRWVMNHAHDLQYHTQPDTNFWGYDVAISGQIYDPRQRTEYFLRWPKKES